MKKILVLLIVIALVLPLVACGKSASNISTTTSESKKDDARERFFAGEELDYVGSMAVNVYLAVQVNYALNKKGIMGKETENIQTKSSAYKLSDGSSSVLVDTLHTNGKNRIDVVVDHKTEMPIVKDVIKAILQSGRYPGDVDNATSFIDGKMPGYMEAPQEGEYEGIYYYLSNTDLNGTPMMRIELAFDIS